MFVKVLGYKRELNVKVCNVARIVDAFLGRCAVLHAAMELACEVCGLAVASGVKTFDAAVIDNHNHRAGEVVVVKKFSALPILKGC